MKTEVVKWVPKLLLIMKWAVIAPILTTALLCLGMVGGSLAWWKIQDKERVHMKPFITDTGEKLMIVDEPSWGFCNEQTITDKTTKKKTTHQERCRKAE